MEESTSREKILKKVRKALVSRGDSFYLNTDFNSPLFQTKKDLPEIIFAQMLREQKGNFIYCNNENEAIEQLHHLFQFKKWGKPFFEEEEIFFFAEKSQINKLPVTTAPGSRIVITLCECLVSDSGTVVVSSLQACGSRFIVDADVHIVIAFDSQMVQSITEAFGYIEKKYENQAPRHITFITGPSKTADIEQELIYGAHGPAELYCFLIEG